MSTDQSSSRPMTVTGHLDVDSPETLFEFADGRVVRLPTALLQAGTSAQMREAETQPGSETILIPLAEEQLQVDKRLVETGRVRLRKGVATHEVVLDEPLAVTGWTVTRVPKHEIVAQAPPVREEGDTTIYPILEERLILTKELVLVEEVRVTRKVSEERDTQTVTLRRETLEVEREASDPL